MQAFSSSFCHVCYHCLVQLGETHCTTAATYHPKGPGSCLSKFQNMKPVNRERPSLFGNPAERSDQNTYSGFPCLLKMVKQQLMVTKKGKKKNSCLGGILIVTLCSDRPT